MLELEDILTPHDLDEFRRLAAPVEHHADWLPIGLPDLEPTSPPDQLYQEMRREIMQHAPGADRGLELAAMEFVTFHHTLRFWINTGEFAITDCIERTEKQRLLAASALPDLLSSELYKNIEQFSEVYRKHYGCSG